jgi:hypothetical protein
MSPITADGGVVELTREEGREMLGERTRRELCMTLEQFEAAYDSGTLDMNRSDVIGLVMLLPFARLASLYLYGSLLAGFPFPVSAGRGAREDRVISLAPLDGEFHAG